MANNKDKIKDWKDLYDVTQPKNADGYILYLRRSKKQKKKSEDDYEPEGTIDKISIEQQRDYCKHIATTRDLNILCTYEEERTAKNPYKREQFSKMLDFIKEYDSEGKTIGILAWSPDRLSRNAIEAGLLIQAYLDRKITDFQFCAYHFTQDETGLEYLMMEFARAMGFTLRLSKTVKRSMQLKYFESKEWLFPDKFGYTRLKKKNDRGELRRVNFSIPSEYTRDGLLSEFEALQMAFELRLKGLSAQRIAEEINKVGYINRYGRIGGKMTKQRLLGGKSKDRTRSGYLRDTFYYGRGEMEWGPIDLTEKTEVDDDGNLLRFTPVLTASEFIKCQEINDDRAKPKSNVYDFLPFRGQLKCYYCKSTLEPQLKKEKYTYYYCYNNSCAHKLEYNKSNTVAGARLYPAVGSILKKDFKLSVEDFTSYLLYLEKMGQIKKQRRKHDLKSIVAKKAHLENKIEAVEAEFATTMTKALGNKTITSDTLGLMQVEHNKNLQRLKDRLNVEEKKEATLRNLDTSWTQNVAQWLEHMQNTHKYWQKANLQQKMIIAKKIFLELVIKNGEIASYRFVDEFKDCKQAISSYNGGRWKT